MDQKQIAEYIKNLEQLTKFLKTLATDEISEPRDKIVEFTNLRLLAKSDKWPEALPDEFVSDEEDFQLYRASRIVNEYITEDLSNKSFLDFGCGQGHVPYFAANFFTVKKSIGYDLKDMNWGHFEAANNLFYSENLNEVRENGPYDVILVNDVLDHCIKPSPQVVLNQIKELKSENGRIYLRMHPWTSRHGMHLHNQLNKAYLHLVFSETELFSIGIKPRMKVHKYLDPVSEYRKLIADSGLIIENEDIVTQNLNPFFTSFETVSARISDNWKNDENLMLATGVGFPQNIMEIQFVDYVLI